MAVYHVGTNSTGERVWWDWQGRSFASHHTDVRDATPEEAALMEKVIWDRHTDADCRRIKELIAIK